MNCMWKTLCQLSQDCFNQMTSSLLDIVLPRCVRTLPVVNSEKPSTGCRLAEVAALRSGNQYRRCHQTPVTQAVKLKVIRVSHDCHQPLQAGRQTLQEYHLWESITECEYHRSSITSRQYSHAPARIAPSEIGECQCCGTRQFQSNR